MGEGECVCEREMKNLPRIQVKRPNTTSPLHCSTRRGREGGREGERERERESERESAKTNLLRRQVK